MVNLSQHKMLQMAIKNFSPHYSWEVKKARAAFLKKFDKKKYLNLLRVINLKRLREKNTLKTLPNCYPLKMNRSNLNRHFIMMIIIFFLHKNGNWTFFIEDLNFFMKNHKIFFCIHLMASKLHYSPYDRQAKKNHKITMTSNHWHHRVK